MIGSDSGPTDPNQETGRPTRTAKAAPATKRRELYSTKPAEAHENGKELESALYSLMGCWSRGTGHPPPVSDDSGGMLLLFLNDAEGNLE